MKGFGAALKTTTALSAPFSICSIAVDTAVNFTNPCLSNGQKWGLLAIDVGFSLLGILAGAFVTVATGGAGVHAGVCASAGISMLGTTLSTWLSNKWSDENEKAW